MALKRKTTRKLAPFAKRELDHKSPELGQRYGDYFFAAKAAGLADIEQVVDFYDIPFRPPVAEAHARDNLSDTAAEALLQKVGPNGWGYHMPLSARYGTMGALDGLSGAYALARKRADYRPSCAAPLRYRALTYATAILSRPACCGRITAWRWIYRLPISMISPHPSRSTWC
jgi:hypothetical protein